jgi:uncharacterized protein YndB with AHSA1/START domain
MSEQSQTLEFTQFVKAPAEQLYRAFTNATAFRDWLCDVATAQPVIGGRLYLWWNSGYYTAGEYTALEPDRQVAFTWQGRGEPGTTRVQVTLQTQEDGVMVRLEHGGLGSGPEWERAGREIREGWERGLENLASVLETGEDIRFVRRPMLGVLISDFDADIARHIGVPVTQGVRLDGTVEGMGARAAGLDKGDVIVSMAGYPVIDFPSLTTALQKHRSGDEVEVGYYRGSEKRTTTMKLSGRPIPTIPASPAGLAEAFRQVNAPDMAALEAVLEGVSDEAASRCPEPGEWCVKEIVAHLILSERANADFTTEIVSGHERWADDFGSNSHERGRSVMAVYPTLPELLAELKRSQEEVYAYLASLPASFSERKGAYWRTAYNLLGPGSHISTHLEQIRAVLGK